MRSFNRSAITVYGTEQFLQWVRENHPKLHHWTLDNLNHHPNAYLVEVEDQNCWGDCFEKYYRQIFRNEVGEYISNGVEWPSVTLDLISNWFRYEYHELVSDLCAEELQAFDDHDT